MLLGIPVRMPGDQGGWAVSMAVSWSPEGLSVLPNSGDYLDLALKLLLVSIFMLVSYTVSSAHAMVQPGGLYALPNPLWSEY